MSARFLLRDNLSPRTPLGDRAMTSSTEYCLRISRAPQLAAVLISLVFPATWILERLGILDVGGIAESSAWTLFVFGFACPVCILLLYLAWRRDPIIEVSGDTIYLRHVTLPWRTTNLSVSEIESVIADWIPRTSRCRLKLHVTRPCFDRECRKSRWLRGKDGSLTMDLNNAEDNPDQVAMALNLLLSQKRKSAV